VSPSAVEEGLDLPESPAVWCSGLAKRYGKRTAVDGVSFTVGRGEVVGLLGPNGAGKTSVIKMLLGLVSPDAGDVLLLGEPADDPRARARVGYLPELFRYQPWLTAAEVLDLHVRLSGADVHAARRRECLAWVGLADRASGLVGSSSSTSPRARWTLSDAPTSATSCSPSRRAASRSCSTPTSSARSSASATAP
jgi:ABC-2 type transport system ATP-binding protein